MIKALVAASAMPFVVSWAQSPQDPGALSGVVPFYNDIGGRTVRDVVRPTLDGSAVRIRVSNLLGTRPLTITDARVARSAGRGATLGPSRRLRFRGRTRVTIPVGAQVTSDAVAFRVRAQHDLAISLYSARPTGRVTGGGSLFHTNYLSGAGIDAAGSASAAAFPTAAKVWYFLTGVDVRPRARAAAVVVIGDSITAGWSSTVDAYRGWVDVLGRRLHANARTRNLAVINAGIAGNNLHEDTDCFGQSVLHRLTRDALDQPGVRAVVIAVGGNDLTHPAQDPATNPCLAHTPISADGMIADYTQAIRRVHARHLKAILATISPFGAYSVWSPQLEQERLVINHWMTTSPLPDGVIDEQVLGDPANPSALLAAYDSGDGLHPNDAGHAALGNDIDLFLLPTP